MGKSRQERLARRERYITARKMGASVKEARRMRDLPCNLWNKVCLAK